MQNISIKSPLLIMLFLLNISPVRAYHEQFIQMIANKLTALENRDHPNQKLINACKKELEICLIRNQKGRNVKKLFNQIEIAKQNIESIDVDLNEASELIDSLVQSDSEKSSLIALENDLVEELQSTKENLINLKKKYQEEKKLFKKAQTEKLQATLTRVTLEETAQNPK